jgi:hypothetical protein
VEEDEKRKGLVNTEVGTQEGHSGGRDATENFMLLSAIVSSL